MKEIMVLSAFMLIIPFYFGVLYLSVFYGSLKQKRLTWRDAYLTGIIICIGLAEVAHLISEFSGRSFSGCVKLYEYILLGAAGLALLVALALLAYRSFAKKKALFSGEKREKPVFTSAEYLICIIAFLVFGYFLWRLATRTDLSFYKDITFETVTSFLQTDKLYGVNPVTGQSYATPIPMRLQILGMPTLYAMLTDLSGVGVESLLMTVVPIAVFLMSMMAFSLIGKSLWPKNRFSRTLFLLVIMLLLLVTDAGEGQVGFGLLHQGFSPQTIRIAVLIPFTLHLLLEKRYFLVLLPIMAEACMVWTFFGTGWCFLLSALWLAVAFFVRLRRRAAGKRGGKA